MRSDSDVGPVEPNPGRLHRPIIRFPVPFTAMARDESSASEKSAANLGFEAKLWLAADKLRNNMDAAEYKHVVLGLIFPKFASAEGKNGGQFYTPSCVVRLLVAILAPYKGRIHDPCCGSGGMFVQSEKFVEAHGGKLGDISIYGQESNATTRRLALMNLAIRGLEADLGPEHADTFRRDLHADLRADYVLANPPFNDSDWYRKDDDLRWQFGVPPKGNANFAWVQHFIHHLAEQRAIAHILGSLDDKIELNRRMNATLEAMARALFQGWFVDFDPVRAKMDGRRPAGMDAATAALFPDAFQESPLGEVPEGWRIGKLGELVELRTDRVDATPAKDQLRYIALEDMPAKSIDLSGFQLGSAVNSSIIEFRKGDVLFGSMRPYFHKVGLAFFEGITRTTTFVLRPREDWFRHFALLHFFSDDVVAYSTTASVGTTIPYVKWDSLESYRIAVPPDSLLAAFEKAVSPLVQRIAAQGEESRTLASLRDTLLPKLLSGEIRL
jgi:hypothetical protein